MEKALKLEMVYSLIMGMAPGGGVDGVAVIEAVKATFVPVAALVGNVLKIYLKSQR